MATGIALAMRATMLDFVFQGATATAPGATAAFGLKDTDPGDANGSGTEPTSGTGNYGRAATNTNFGTTNWNASTTGSNPATVTNKLSVAFPTSNAAWSTGATTLGFFILMSSATVGSGTFYARGTVTPATAVNATGITLSFPASQLSFTNAFT